MVKAYRASAFSISDEKADALFIALKFHGIVSRGILKAAYQGG